LSKENEPKEKAAFHLVTQRVTPLCCSQRTGDVGMSHPNMGVLRRIANPLFAPLLGSVKWQKLKYLLIK